MCQHGAHDARRNQALDGDARIRPVMSQPDLTSRRQVQGDVAALAGAIERAAGDLTMAEEPSNFAVVLQVGAPRE
jgi:hypothetical protein